MTAIFHPCPRYFRNLAIFRRTKLRLPSDRPTNCWLSQRDRNRRRHRGTGRQLHWAETNAVCRFLGPILLSVLIRRYLSFRDLTCPVLIQEPVSRKRGDMKIGFWYCVNVLLHALYMRLRHSLHDERIPTLIGQTRGDDRSARWSYGASPNIVCDTTHSTVTRDYSVRTR
jgi:hypothetical protein